MTTGYILAASLVGQRTAEEIVLRVSTPFLRRAHPDLADWKSSLRKDRAILTHSPDRITSEWALCDREKSFKIKGKKFLEMVGDKLYPMDADIYYKEDGTYLVGYRNEKGSYKVYDKNGSLSLSNKNEPDLGTPLFSVDVYEDISGRYFPILETKNAVYRERIDGKVERVEFTESGSTGRIIENHREP